jgi:hypothetical protein
MALATYSPTWISTLIPLLTFPTGNPAYATGKASFATSIVNGLVLGMTGTPVTTVDTGTSGPIGAGTGVGVFGFNIPIFNSTFASMCTLKFQNFTLENSTVMSAIGTTFTTALANVSIITTHTPVAAGTGVVTLIPPEVTKLSSSLYISAIPPINQNPVYSRWYDYSEIIATAISAGCVGVTGAVVIAGTPIVPPVPIAGTGTGVIT